MDAPCGADSARHQQRPESVGNVFRQTAKILLESPIVEWMEAKVPLLQAIHRRQYERRFGRVTPFARRFHGVYTTFEEAMRAAPKSKPMGYDNPAAATLMSHSGPLWLSDYPVLFWLEKALSEVSSVIDIGGYVGISYYSFRKYLHCFEQINWMIYDVPAVAQAGIEIARRESSLGLSFTTELNSNIQAHTVLALGSLQFCEHDLPELLSRLGSLPTHVILNKMPLSEGPDFVTLQDLGPAVCPYRIFNSARFIQSVENLGYRLVDHWANAEFSCNIPFHADRRVPSYSGLYFRAKE
jgi:putative methyltransferase (TIGR04325 family)